MSENKKPPADECVLPPANPVPPSELHRYSPNRDQHSEKDISDYVEAQARGETVQHVEKVRDEVVLGEKYEIWDVVTDKDRWWVLTSLTNLYSQKHFPSLDYTLSFHIGLMARIKERSTKEREPSPFEEVFRRLDQAKEQFDQAIESEQYQAVGVQLRECMLSLISALRRRAQLALTGDQPQDANFLAWIEILLNHLCPGGSNKEIRQYSKFITKEAWQLVNWLTHHRNATERDSMVVVFAADQAVSTAIHLFHGYKSEMAQTCSACGSRHIRSHYDISIGDEGEYYVSCGACGWTDHPSDRTG